MEGKTKLAIFLLWPYLDFNEIFDCWLIDHTELQVSLGKVKLKTIVTTDLFC